MAACHACGAPIEHDAIALNLRLRGRAIGRLDCIPCLAERLDSPEAVLHEWIEYFKQTHCILFQRPEGGAADSEEEGSKETG